MMEQGLKEGLTDYKLTVPVSQLKGTVLPVCQVDHLISVCRKNPWSQWHTGAYTHTHGRMMQPLHPPDAGRLSHKRL